MASKAKPCSIQGCPALRAKGSYVCAAHASELTQARTPGRRGHKFGAVATEVDGIRFASKAEARRYQVLKLREKAGEIRDLKLQTRWRLEVNGVLIGHYVSDFDYLALGCPRRTVEDVKGVKTPLYKFKRRIFEALYGLVIVEVA